MPGGLYDEHLFTQRPTSDDIQCRPVYHSYGNDGLPKEGKRRYSPATLTSIDKLRVFGNPDESKISASIVERSNLSLRTNNRRFGRLTNAFSKRLENRMHVVSFYFMAYNIVKTHKTINTTPAMEAGVTDFL